MTEETFFKIFRIWVVGILFLLLLFTACSLSSAYLENRYWANIVTEQDLGIKEQNLRIKRLLIEYRLLTIKSDSLKTIINKKQ